MQKEDLRIVYLGTPEFAVEGLRALVDGGYNVVAVVTMPDKPAGRGHQLQFSPVKQYALEHGLPILQPERLKEERFVEELRSYQADLQVVVAFRMLPEVVWAMPRLGTFNIHGSLLPQYRGAAPINWAVMNGDTETGLTSFMLRHDIDTGNMILQERTPIGPDENVGDIHDRLMAMSGMLLTKTVDLIIDCENRGVALPTTPQPEDVELRTAPKIFKETCRIDLTRTVEEVRNQIRGLSPYPAATTPQLTSLMGEEWVIPEGTKVFRAEPTDVPNRKGHIIVKCADGWLDLLELQLPGKKRMDAKSLLNGLRTH